MILFDPDQPEAVEGFPRLSPAAAGRRAALPAKQTLARYLREAQGAVGLVGEVSVLLTTDDGIRLLNRRFRKKNKATDVLSFPVDNTSSGIAGDLAISVEMAARQAGEQRHRLSVELRVLMLHGLLHLAGMDHETDDGKMARRERRLRKQMGLPLGLIERVEERGQGIGNREQGLGISDQKSNSKTRSRFPAGMTDKRTKTKTKAEIKTKTEARAVSGTAAVSMRGAR